MSMASGTRVRVVADCYSWAPIGSGGVVIDDPRRPAREWCFPIAVEFVGASRPLGRPPQPSIVGRQVLFFRANEIEVLA